MIINPYVFGGGGGGGTLYDEITARLGPDDRYFRLADTSGTTMTAEAGANGTYSSSAFLNQTAIYPGGPVCIKADSSGYQGVFTGNPATINEFSLFCVVYPTSLSGFTGLLSRDDGSSRKWQWRTNGTTIEFVKIAGSVQTVSSPSSVIDTASAHTIGLSVSSAGAVVMYVDGASVHSASVTASDYGGAAPSQIGFFTGGGVNGVGYFSEAAVFYSVLSPTDYATLHTASGL